MKPFYSLLRPATKAKKARKGNISSPEPLSPGLVHLIIFLSFISTVHINIHPFCISRSGQDVCHQGFFQFLTHLLYSLFLFPFQRQNQETRVTGQGMEM